MSRLVLVGDAAYPDLSLCPKDMFAFCAYFGGDTPHIVEDKEITAIRARGMQFWPIWTAPNWKNGTAIDAGIGARDASQMLIELQKRGIDKSTPVFYDIEYSTYRANKVGAIAAARAFQATLLAGGYPNAFPYMPKDYGGGWVAWWTNVRPTALPLGWVGQQYSGTDGRIDFSIFDLDRLGVDMSSPISDNDIERIATKTRDMVSATLQAYIPAELGGTIQRIVTMLGLSQQEAADIAAIKAKLASFGTPDSGMTVDEQHTFAVELAKVFGTALDHAA